MDIAAPFLRAAIAVALVIVLTRIVGLRSFSKMTGFDFVCTVAIGSLLAAAVTASGWAFAVALLALAAVFATQWIAAWLRARSGRVRDAMDNRPLLLMENGTLLHENIADAHMTEDDIFAKLREANALDLSRVRAVVLEATGDISVLHGDPGTEISPRILDGVHRGEYPSAGEVG